MKFKAVCANCKFYHNASCSHFWIDRPNEQTCDDFRQNEPNQDRKERTDMTVNQALIVCEILKFHGYGDYSLTTDCGYAGIGKFPDSYDKDDKIINMEGMKSFNSDKWICHDDLIQICDEIEEALKGAGLS